MICRADKQKKGSNKKRRRKKSRAVEVSLSRKNSSSIVYVQNRVSQADGESKSQPKKDARHHACPLAKRIIDARCQTRRGVLCACAPTRLNSMAACQSSVLARSCALDACAHCKTVLSASINSSPVCRQQWRIHLACAVDFDRALRSVVSPPRS